MALNVPHVEICREVFAHHAYYSAEKLFRDVPEFRPVVSLEEGMRRVIDAMDQAGRIPDSDLEDWEDRILAAHGKEPMGDRERRHRGPTGDTLVGR
jgi:hypothetical protein